LLDGLGSDATLEINATEGVLDANGVIYVGPSSPPNPLNDITFDGSIAVYDDGSGGGGDLRGAIVVVGCHATADNLEICLEGGDGGENIKIKQNGCTNQVGWSCPGIGL